MDEQVEFRLIGDGAEPGKVRAHDLADIIKALEDTVAAYVLTKEPTLDKESICVGLTSIGSGSLTLNFEMNFWEYTLAAFRAVAYAVAHNSFDILPRPVLAPLRELNGAIRQRGFQAEFRITSHAEPLAVLTETTKIPATPVLTGTTMIYGEVLRVGGAEPKIMFRTTQGHTIYCETSRSIAQAAANYLYATTALRGQATWNGETLEIERFLVEELLEYTPTSANAAFAELASLVDDSFYDIASPEHFLRGLRE